MRGITVHLSEIFDEQEREQKQRARKSFAYAAAIALIGIAVGLRKPDIEFVPVPVRAPGISFPADPLVIERRITLQASAPPPTPAARAAAPIELLAFTTSFARFDAPGVHPGTRQLCISPKRISFRGDRPTHEQRVTVSNPSERPVTITRIATVTDRAVSGFSVDSRDCDNRTLEPKGHCTVTLTLSRRIGETLELLIFNDAGEPEPLLVLAPEV